MGDEPIADLENELADLWRQGRDRARRRARAIEPRLDPTHYLLLTVLARHESVPMSELVTELGLDKSTVTRQVDTIVRMGLAERHPDPRDARARVVSLTPAGRHKFETVIATFVQEWRDQLAQWDPDDIRTLTRLLRRLSAVRTSEPAHAAPDLPDSDES
ncbi:MarR family transcriptional regulator [Gordonia desulfuricans]|uniref:MarR family transcriptional regulator n=1 Tax=Gordonia desulfuricans TaxID=89051 RepID=A0A7K3LTP3_9ACTN|nr:MULTISPECIES: MarR family transcriptional regulator [Gordonia]EMP14089.1 MarR family transcriptional regulator [Gordonia sp. NB41Y]NDK90927.1 MarR family transcriptional regulator [Gordonia desulfuricans]WLP92431.1 MarR family transcriptional regulator [Gordonia sp. NB41Y]